MRLPSLPLPQLVTAALATAIGLQLAWMVTGAFGARDTLPTLIAPARTTDPLAPLKAARLFGTAEGMPATPAPTATLSTQGLVLAGVLAEVDPRAGRAIIGESGGRAQVYAVGGTLPGGSRLAEVHVDRVILDRGGNLETLPLPRHGGPSATALSPNTTTAAGSATTDLSEVIRWQAVMRSDKPSGVRVYPAADVRAFNQLGLRPGDLVLAVNDTPLADQANSEQFLRSLAGVPQVRLTVERAGRTENLVIDLTQLGRAPEGSSPTAPLN